MNLKELQKKLENEKIKRNQAIKLLEKHFYNVMQLEQKIAKLSQQKSYNAFRARDLLCEIKELYSEKPQYINQVFEFMCEYLTECETPLKTLINRREREVDELMLKYRVTPFEDKTFGFKSNLDIAVFINNERFFSQFHFNLPFVEYDIDTTISEKESELFVCGCGDEGCAGIFTTPLIKREGDFLIWEIYEPTRHTFKFKTSQVKAEFKALRESMIKDYGFEFWKKCSYFAVDSALNIVEYNGSKFAEKVEKLYFIKNDYGGLFNDKDEGIDIWCIEEELGCKFGESDEFQKDLEDWINEYLNTDLTFEKNNEKVNKTTREKRDALYERGKVLKERLQNILPNTCVVELEFT